VNPRSLHRLAGLCGLAGALLFFAGDMLFYGYFGAGAGFIEGMHLTVKAASLERLFAGGLVGPAAACLCIVGFWHVYRNVRSEAALAGRIMFASFFMLMVAGSAVHALWTAKGLAMKFCTGPVPDCATLRAAIQSYWTIAYNMGATPGYFGAAMLAILVVLGKTRYPRWTILANPAALILLSPLAERVPSPIGAVLVGGSANLAIAIFFLVSCVTTWNTSPGEHAGPQVLHELEVAAK
jgi:hypothetical protein